MASLHMPTEVEGGGGTVWASHKLLMRAGPEKDSAKTSEVPSGTPLTVLEQITTERGTVRALVSFTTADGGATQGWVSAVAEDGTSHLTDSTETVAARTKMRRASVVAAIYALKEAGQQPHMGEPPPTESMPALATARSMSAPAVSRPVDWP